MDSWRHDMPTVCELQPLLVSHKPLAVSSIRISEFTPGDVAPVCTGIKFLNTHVANEVRPRGKRGWEVV